MQPALGNGHATFTRFSHWADKGVWARVAQRRARDLEEVMLASTAITAHHHATSAALCDLRA